MRALIAKPYVRSVAGLVLAAIAYVASAGHLSEETRLLLAWNVATLYLLGMLALIMLHSDATQTYRRSQDEEPRHVGSVVVAVLGSLVGLGGTVAMLDGTKEMSGWGARLHIALSVLTVVTAWLIVHVYFALTYARAYYDETAEGGGTFAKGLAFPDAEMVDYWDFVYYSLTIAMCYQTSDVTVTSPQMRRLTIVHSVLSFFFVMAVLGIAVNIIGTLL